jgi:hypothetical protein
MSEGGTHQFLASSIHSLTRTGDVSDILTQSEKSKDVAHFLEDSK